MIYLRNGKSAGVTSTLIDLACPGMRLINSFFSSFKIIWWTVGGVTLKYLWISASEGA
jgi:hypothetical protein